MTTLSIIDVVLLVLSCIHSSEIHVLIHDKFLRALMAFEWNDLILNKRIN